MILSNAPLKRILLVLALALLSACGGGGGGGNDDGTSRLQGTAFNPPGVDPGKVVAANAPVTVIDFSKPSGSNVVANGTTDSNGKYDVTVPKTPLVAVIVQGRAQVSGLLQADPSAKSLEFSKDFDGATDIACRAGAQLLTTGVYTATTFTSDNIDNLESAAQDLVDAGVVDFLDPNSVALAVSTILAQTNNAANHT